jgi:hypothetical protein
MPWTGIYGKVALNSQCSRGPTKAVAGLSVAADRGERQQGILELSKANINQFQ